MWEMAPRFLVLSRLASWNGGEVELIPTVRIRRLAEAERDAVDPPEREGWWLRHEFENPHSPELVRHKRQREAGFKLMQHAMYAVQVLAPCGTTAVYQMYRRDGQSWVPEGSERRQPMLPTAWCRRSAIPATFAADIGTVLERVLEVFHNPILRLQIPIWMMEQALSAPDQHIRILLCATALDSLTKSSGQAAFKDRLSELLGADRLIFPPDAVGFQPRYRVREVAGHLYELRNELAHGLPFDAIFHKKVGFLNGDGEPAAPEFAKYRYDQVLEECAVFLLCRVLREVLLRRLVYDVRLTEWKSD